MNRELAKNKAQSRGCHCIKEKDRDNNYNEVIDEIFDWHERIIEKLHIQNANKKRESLKIFYKHLVKEGLSPDIDDYFLEEQINKLNTL